MNTDEVTTREDLVAFIVKLRVSLLENPQEWENNDLDSFLAAFAAFMSDIDGYYRNWGIDIDATQPSWRLFADALAGASVYE